MSTQQQKQFKVLLIGDSCLDLYHYGNCDRISPEAPVPVFQHQHTIENEGMVLNVANNLKAFGIETDIWTNKEQIRKERFVDIKSKQHLLRSDFGESEKVQSLVVGGLTTLAMLRDDSYDCLIFSDYNKGFVTPFVIEAVQNLFQKKIFVDTKKTDLSVFKNCIIKVNEKEYSNITDFGVNNEIITTLGPNGARWKEKQYPTQKVEVSDVSGAGDTFLASLVYGYLLKNNLESAIKCANMCASVVVQKSGTYALKEEDVNDILF
tara:strand:+ start:284 stop:1075 length:792 start_codon:yes stop_codon:yes gene_type:complete